MTNDQRTSVYLRDRTRLTPAQRRRVQKHDNDAKAVAGRSLRRRAHRDVLRAERKRRLSIRAMFTRKAAS